jgi:hypothetical protein
VPSSAIHAVKPNEESVCDACNSGSHITYGIINVLNVFVEKIHNYVVIIIIIIIIIIIAIATWRPRLHSHQSDTPQYIKTLDSTGIEVTINKALH